MTHEARPRIAGEKAPAGRSKALRMRRDSRPRGGSLTRPAHARRGVTRSAVALLVARHAFIHVQTGLNGVVATRAGSIGPDGRGRVEAPLHRPGCAGATWTQAGAQMARQTFGLRSVTGVASSSFLPRLDTMQTEPITRVNHARPQPPVMTVHTFGFLVTSQAHWAANHRGIAMLPQPSGIVPHRPKNTRRQEAPLSESRLDDPAA